MVSPYVSALIMTLIVLGVGSAILAYAIPTFLSYKQEIERASHIEPPGLTLMTSYIVNGRLIAVLYAQRPTKVLSVYVNGSLYSDRCVFLVNDSPTTLPTIVPAESVLAINCSLSSTATFVSFSIATQSYVVRGYASAIS